MLQRIALSSFCVLCLPWLADYPRNKFEAEVSYSSSYRAVGEFQLDSMTQRVNGQEINVGDPKMSGSVEHSFAFTDTFVEVKDGKLTKRERSVEEASGKTHLAVEMAGSGESHDAELSSPLVGQTVLCEWSEDDEVHEFSFTEDSEGESRWLEGLVADAEFQVLPPEDEVEVGDSWTIDLADQRSFFAPGGSLSWEPEIADGSFQLVDPQHVVAICLVNLGDTSQEIDGELTVSWAETNEVDGEQVARLELELSAELDADLSDELTRMASAAGLSDKDPEFSCTWELEGEGEVLWNLERGHFVSLSLEFENQIEFRLAWEEDFGPIEVEAEVSGSSKWEAESEVE